VRAPADALPPLSEKEFQRQVLSKWSERGWPDLALVRPPRLVFAELKRENGKTTEYQDRWLGLLRGVPGVEVFLWRPTDLEQIAVVLR
jgi:hypothetical protein